MFIVLLKIKDRIYFESLDTQNEVVEYIEAVETKFGIIEYSESSIVEGSDKDINYIMELIDEHFYLYILGRKIESKVYNDLLSMIENSKLKIKITHGIEFEDDESVDDSGTTLNTNTLTDIIQEINDDPIYVINFLISSELIIIGLNLDITKYTFEKTKSFKQTFDNLDESLSIYEGFKYDFMEIITSESEDHIMLEYNEKNVNFIETKINLMDWKELQGIKYMDGNYKKKTTSNNEVYCENDYLTAREVMRMLRISDQTLANWRKNNLIEFKKITNRKFLYPLDSVQDIFENGIAIPISLDLDDVTYNTKNLYKPQKINYELEIIKMLKPIAYKIPEYKREKQNYFLNFGNIGLVSSPQVMINNDFQLVDFIKKSVIVSNAEELYDYLVGIFKDGKQPRLDTSKRIQPEFSNFYINKLFNMEI